MLVKYSSLKIFGKKRAGPFQQVYVFFILILTYCSSLYIQYTEAAFQRCSVKKVFLEISQNSQENTCARVSFLIQLQGSPATLLKKRLWHRCFPVNFAKFLRTPFLTEYIRWLLLNIVHLKLSCIYFFCVD